MSQRFVPRRVQGPPTWPAVVFLISRAPRTKNELYRLSGHTRQAVLRNLRLLEAEGLIRPAGKRDPEAPLGRKAQVWEWVNP